MDHNRSNDNRLRSLRSRRAQPTGDISVRQIASLIRSLDSRLVAIEYDEQAGAPALIYTFELAGQTEVFAVPIEPSGLFSIIDLYPEAAAAERELQHRHGLCFQQLTG